MNHDLEWAGWFGGLLIAALMILLAGMWIWLCYQRGSPLDAILQQRLLKVLTFALVPTCLLALITVFANTHVVWLCMLILPSVTGAIAFLPCSPWHLAKNMTTARAVVTVMIVMAALPLAAHLAAQHIVNKRHAGESWHLWRRPDGTAWLVKEAWYDPHQLLFIGALDLRRIGYPEMVIGRAELASPRCNLSNASAAFTLSPTLPRTFGSTTPLPMRAGCLGQDWIEVPATRRAVLAAVDLILKDNAIATWEGLIAHDDNNARARRFFDNGSE